VNSTHRTKVFHLLVSTIVIFFSFVNFAQGNDKKPENVNWTSWGGDSEGTRYSELDQINVENAASLQLVWMQPLGVKGNYEGGPLIVDNMIYLHTPASLNYMILFFVFCIQQLSIYSHI